MKKNPLREYLMSHRGEALKIANALGITKQAVWAWHSIPAHYVLRVEEMTGISRHRLRPDVYGIEKSHSEAVK